MTCIFCQSDGPFTTVEHVIPASLGNDDLLLEGQVCDKCQRYFGKELEKYVLGKTPFAFWRTYLGIRTKKGEWPSVDLSQPKKQRGILPAVHPAHDDSVGFSFHDDLSVSVDIDNPDTVAEIGDQKRNEFRFVMSPKMLHMLGRFLCKVGIELLCLNDPDEACLPELDLARRYARYGEFEGLWPILHYSKGHLQDFRQSNADGEDLVEKIECYSYALFEYANEYMLFRLSMGTDNWVICLNDPYPHPAIRNAFPGDDLRLIWYSKDEVG